MGEALASLPDASEKSSGNPQPSPVPTLEAVVPRLLQDPYLEPVDTIVWLVIRQYAAEHGQQKAFPGYRTIARWAHIASASTISRAVAILRVTRWLSVHMAVRAPDGRFSRIGYRLHPAPAPMAETLAADPDYLPFLRAACNHHHARVRRVAQRVLTAMEADRKRDVDASGSGVDLSSLPRAEEEQASGPIASGGNSSYGTPPMTRLQSASPSPPVTDHNQKSNGGSSWCLNKPTTTPDSVDGRNSNTGDTTPRLVYPERLTPQQRETAARHLAAIPDSRRQAVLDELEGRLRAERQGAKPVYDALSYLRHLCGKVNAGTFEASMGLEVQAERGKRHEAAEQRQRARRALQSTEQNQRASDVRRDVGAQLAALKTALGGRPRADPPSTDEA
jgi:hypothetical protein